VAARTTSGRGQINVIAQFCTDFQLHHDLRQRIGTDYAQIYAGHKKHS